MLDARWVDAELEVNARAKTVSGIPKLLFELDITQLDINWMEDASFGSRVRIRPGFARFIDPVVRDSNPQRTVL